MADEKEVIKTKEQLAAEEREKISVTKSEVEKTPEQIKADEKAKEEREAEANKEKTEKEDKKSEDTNKPDDAKKPDDEEEIDATDKDPEKLAKTIERLQKRIDKLTSKNKEKEELIKQVTELQTKEGKPVLTEDDVEKLAEAKAAQKVAERQFVEACNRLADAAEKLDQKFQAKVKEMSEEIGPLPSVMIGILDDLKNNGGAAILNYFVNNIDEAERYYQMPHVKMGVELADLAHELAKQAETKPKPKAISKAPAQSEPPGGTSKVDNQLRDDEPIEDWIAKRNRQVAERLAAKRAGMR